jgi:selT/selW/selH-like putative selenoprotein
LADELKSRFGMEVELIKGRDGVFEVTHDGDLIYSKKSTGRFPDDDEVEAIIQTRLDAS